MKFRDACFRKLYHRFVVFRIGERERDMLDMFPGYEKADCVLAYGYYDSMAGISLETLELGRKTENGCEFFGPRNDVMFMFRFGAIADIDFWYPDNEDELREKHTFKIEAVHRSYAANEKVEASRKLEVLDPLRYESCPDDVQVLFLKDGIKPEACWVTITDMEGSHFRGKLLNEPCADFGVHCGDTVPFELGKGRDGQPILYAVFG